ncbi:hypothetical protein J6590_055801 [Homalodisca vitripennis]|nr:hypothetical protein J6590_055801 [Homalodisca vitripennis]
MASRVHPTSTRAHSSYDAKLLKNPFCLLQRRYHRRDKSPGLPAACQTFKLHLEVELEHIHGALTLNNFLEFHIFFLPREDAYKYACPVFQIRLLLDEVFNQGDFNAAGFVTVKAHLFITFVSLSIDYYIMCEQNLEYLRDMTGMLILNINNGTEDIVSTALATENTS